MLVVRAVVAADAGAAQPRPGRVMPLDAALSRITSLVEPHSSTAPSWRSRAWRAGTDTACTAELPVSARDAAVAAACRGS
ncbi:hypothetical protein NKG94_31975 [Micromonospora sp. M12]